MKNSSPTLYDVIIVGAGAAGLMAAIQCGRQSLKTLLVDGRQKIGAKILMSGGTRCNVTNLEIQEKDFFGENPKRIRNVLRAFPSSKTISFFEEIGVKLLEEPGGKLFPETHSAQTVLDALINALKDSGAQLETGQKITGIQKSEIGFEVQSAEKTYQTQIVVLATGGLSYPNTGSDGSGYELAKHFSHNLVQTLPALTPFRSKSKTWQKLSGLSLPARLTLQANKEKIQTFEGDFLFTHFGFSGPVALNMSRHWQKSRPLESQILVSFLPKWHEDKLIKKLKEDRQKTPKKQLSSLLAEHLPNRFVETCLNELKIPQTRIITELKKTEQATLVKLLFGYELPVDDVWGYQKAEVTAGGVALDEIDTATMESKKQPGLFFVGEILDADGRIGGFNFQWAWASGTVAATGIKRSILRFKQP